MCNRQDLRLLIVVIVLQTDQQGRGSCPARIRDVGWQAACAVREDEDLVTILFENALHRHAENHIYFAKRGSRERQALLSEAIRLGLQRFEEKWGQPVTTAFEIQAQTPKGEPCLSVIDYMNWAVYRAFTRGDMGYFQTIEEKVSLLVDLYDTQKYPKNWYNRRNKFDLKKITPL